MKSYFTVNFYLPEETMDWVSSELFDYSGFCGMEESFDQLIISFDGNLITENEVLDLLNNLKENILKQFPDFNTYFKIENLEDKNWNEDWEKTIKPIVIDDYFCVYPSWDLPTHIYPIMIEIDPKMSFGTGYHETTRLMMRAIRNLELTNKSILDCGTGTGVLGIAALKLGAKDVFGFDIDEWSYDNCLENLKKNSIENQFEMYLGGYETIPQHKKYDIILANVNKLVHKEYGHYYVTHLNDQGSIYLSGILKYDEQDIITHFKLLGFSHFNSIAENEWICLEIKK